MPMRRVASSGAGGTLIDFSAELDYKETISGFDFVGGVTSNQPNGEKILRNDAMIVVGSDDYVRHLDFFRKVSAAKRVAKTLVAEKTDGKIFPGVWDGKSIDQDTEGHHSHLGAEVCAKYDEAEVNMKKSLPFKFVVDKATPNEYKAKPVRWLIILLSTASAFALAIILLILGERYKSLKSKLNS